MKKLWIILFVFMFPALSQAADTKGSALSAPAGGAARTDKVYIIDDPAGTPVSTADTIANLLGLIQAADISDAGTGVAAALAVNVGSAGAPVVLNGALGTPSSGTLTNATGLPIGTGVSGLGSNVATFLATPSSANFAAAITDETGTGAVVLAGAPTFTGEVTFAINGVEFQETDTITDCSSFAATGGGIFYDDSEGKFKKCQDNVLSDLDNDTGGATAYNNIGDPTDNGSISFGAYTGAYTSATDGWGGITIDNTTVDNASPTTLLTLKFADANDVTNNSFLKIIEDSDGTPVTLFEFKGRGLYLGATATIQNIATMTASSYFAPQSADGATLGTSSLEFSDLYLADGGVIYGQNDQSATLTSSASLWTANNFAVTTQFKLPSSDADPSATAGNLRHDSTITNFTNGGLVYYNGAAIKQLVDMTTATAQACTDDQVVAYDAINDLWYCKDDSTGSGSLGSNLSSTTNDILSDTGTAVLGGTGNTNNENLSLDFETTANTVAVGTSTGVTDISFGAININTTGVIKGRASYGADITGAVNHDTTATHGVFYHFTAAATVTLDAAADAGYGAQVCYRARDDAEAYVIDIQAGEKINLDGTALAAGTAITTSTQGSTVCMVATTDTDGSGTDGWETWGNNGWASE